MQSTFKPASTRCRSDVRASPNTTTARSSPYTTPGTWAERSKMCCGITVGVKARLAGVSLSRPSPVDDAAAGDGGRGSLFMRSQHSSRGPSNSRALNC